MKTKGLPRNGTPGWYQVGAPVPPTTLKECKQPLPLFKIRTILVPVDFSECSLGAIDYAVGLAELSHAKVILLHIVEPALYPENYLAATQALEETSRNLLECGRQRLEGLSRKRIANRVAAETIVRMGRAPSEIPDTARALGADLIVIATHGHTGVKHVLLGSTAERVVRQSPCPVMTVPCGH